MAQQKHPGGGSAVPQSSQFGDTTYTKIFVGGLPWEAQVDTMRAYFEQFGEILEAVIIYDRSTGRSKGYGFVTFRDAESASRACQDPNPVIGGRRTNCNLASLGQKQRHQHQPHQQQPHQQQQQQQQQPAMQQSSSPVMGYQSPAFIPYHPPGFPQYAYPPAYQDPATYGFSQGVFPQYGAQAFPAAPAGVYAAPMGVAPPGAIFNPQAAQQAAAAAAAAGYPSPAFHLAQQGSPVFAPQAPGASPPTMAALPDYFAGHTLPQAAVARQPHAYAQQAAGVGLQQGVGVPSAPQQAGVLAGQQAGGVALQQGGALPSVAVQQAAILQQQAQQPLQQAVPLLQQQQQQQGVQLAAGGQGLLVGQQQPMKPAPDNPPQDPTQAG